jgi:hypothetical protein
VDSWKENIIRDPTSRRQTFNSLQIRTLAHHHRKCQENKLKWVSVALKHLKCEEPLSLLQEAGCSDINMLVCALKSE